MKITYSKLWSLSSSRTTLYGGRPSVSRAVSSRGGATVPGTLMLEPMIAPNLPLPALPLRLALFEEGAHAFLGVGEGGVEGHDLLGVGVRLLDGHLDLAIEGLLTDAHDERAGLGDLVRQLLGLRVELLRRDNFVHQPLGEGLLGGDEVAGEEHLHRLFLSYRAAQGHHRGGAEQPDLDPGGREAGSLRGDNEVTGGGELAARSGGRSMYLGDDRLGDRLHRLHELAADVENVTVGVGVAPDHLREVVTRAERRTVAAEDDDLRLSGLAHGFETARQLLHVRERQGVAFFGAVHRKAGHRPGAGPGSWTLRPAGSRSRAPACRPTARRGRPSLHPPRCPPAARRPVRARGPLLRPPRPTPRRGRGPLAARGAPPPQRRSRARSPRTRAPTPAAR